jgi:hypothetical protein
MLDSAHALCLETWLLENAQSQFNRWTRLVRRDNGWTVQSTEDGEPE